LLLITGVKKWCNVGPLSASGCKLRKVSFLRVQQLVTTDPVPCAAEPHLAFLKVSGQFSEICCELMFLVPEASNPSKIHDENEPFLGGGTH
jgi:hypothetical protein